MQRLMSCKIRYSVSTSIEEWQGKDSLASLMHVQERSQINLPHLIALTPKLSDLHISPTVSFIVDKNEKFSVVAFRHYVYMCSGKPREAGCSLWKTAFRVFDPESMKTFYSLGQYGLVLQNSVIRERTLAQKQSCQNIMYNDNSFLYFYWAVEIHIP